MTATNESHVPRGTVERFLFDYDRVSDFEFEVLRKYHPELLLDLVAHRVNQLCFWRPATRVVPRD